MVAESGTVHINNVNYNFSINARYSKLFEAAMGTTCLAGAVSVNLTSPVGWVLTSMGSSGLTNAALKDMHERNFAFATPKVEAAKYLLATACTVALVAGARLSTLSALYVGMHVSCHDKLKLPAGICSTSASYYDETSHVQASRATWFATAAFAIPRIAPYTTLDLPLAAICLGMAAHNAYVACHRYNEGDVSPSVYFAENTTAV